jgi:hypothetical protein
MAEKKDIVARDVLYGNGPSAGFKLGYPVDHDERKSLRYQLLYFLKIEAHLFPSYFPTTKAVLLP